MSSPTHDNPEDQDASDLEVGDQVFPLGLLDDPHDQNQELELGDWGDDLDLPVDPDDAEGPLENTVDELISASSSGPEENETEEEDTSAIEASIDFDAPAPSVVPNEIPDSESDSEDYVLTNDTELCWSSQPWCEHRLPRAFAAHAGLAAIGNLIVATGDSTELLSADGLEVIDAAPTAERTIAAATLDNAATRVLLTTTTGQLLLWDRQQHIIRSQMVDDLQKVSRITCLCQGQAGVFDAWLLGDGLVFCRTPELDAFKHIPTGDTYLWIAPTESGLLGLTQDYRLVGISAQSRVATASADLPNLPNRGALAKNPVLAAARASILVGARESGAWLSTDGARSFQELAGCQNVTACAFGVCSGRACCWLALFYELDDRTDLVVVDCKTRRVSKLAKFSVVTDTPGPDDDPPERARVDCLHWDPSRQRLWAAGCFGITCFEPPQNLQPPC